MKPTFAFTGQPYGVFDEPRDEIYPLFQWLPGACHPPVHPFLNLKRDLDFVFLGALTYDRRLELCKTVEKAGFNVYYGQVPVKDYALFHNRSLCTMECSGGQQYVKWRIFEAMSMGSLVISDSFRLLDTLFSSGIHYLSCDFGNQDDGRRALNADALIKCIKTLKENPDLREKITDEAFSVVRKKHTYFHRARNILEKLGVS